MKLGVVGDIRDKLKFRHHGNMAAILKLFKQHFIPNNTFLIELNLGGRLCMVLFWYIIWSPFCSSLNLI